MEGCNKQLKDQELDGGISIWSLGRIRTGLLLYSVTRGLENECV